MAVDIDPSSISACIKRFAQTRGIRPHNLTAYLTQQLGWDRYMVHRRLTNTVEWKSAELEQVAAIFRIPVPELTSFGKPTATAQASAVIQHRAEKVPAKLSFMPGTSAYVEIGTPSDVNSQWVAVKQGVNLVVYVRAQAGAVQGPQLPVNRIVLEAAKPHTVAVLEDDEAAASILEAALTDAGLVGRLFTKAEDLVASLGTPYDAFVFDWYLGRRAIALPTLELVRSKFPSAPIFVTSGKIDKAGEVHLLELCAKHDATLVSKPYRPNLVAYDIRRAITAAEVSGLIAS